MPAKHPHADATYRIVSDAELRYAVEVSIPEARPTMVSSFATERDAENWIAWHRGRVAENSRLSPARWMRSRPKASDQSPPKPS